MLDPKLLRSDPAAVAANLARRGFKLDVARLDALEESRKKWQVRADELRNERNVHAKTVGKAKAQGQDIAPLLKQVETLGAELTEAEAELAKVQAELDDIAARLAEHAARRACRTGATKLRTSRSGAGASRASSTSSRAITSRSARSWGRWISPRPARFPARASPC